MTSPSPAKREGWGEGKIQKALILTFSQREKEIRSAERYLII